MAPCPLECTHTRLVVLGTAHLTSAGGARPPSREDLISLQFKFPGRNSNMQPGAHHACTAGMQRLRNTTTTTCQHKRWSHMRPKHSQWPLPTLVVMHAHQHTFLHGGQLWNQTAADMISLDRTCQCRKTCRVRHPAMKLLTTSPATGTADVLSVTTQQCHWMTGTSVMVSLQSRS
jgi:hypothetical protein